MFKQMIIDKYEWNNAIQKMQWKIENIVLIIIKHLQMNQILVLSFVLRIVTWS